MTYGFSHRGVRMGNEENTLAAFDRAVAAGLTHLESDVHASADGTVYLFHDETVDRITEATGPFSGFTDRQLEALRAGGEKLCTLQELLDAYPDALLNIDVKDDTVIDPLARLIERRGAHRQIALASFSTRRSGKVAAKLSAPIRRSPGQWRLVAIWVCAHVLGRVPKRLTRDFWAVQVPTRQWLVPVTTRRFISAVQAAGAQIHVWVVNDEPSMRALMAKNVDAIISDDAALLVRVLGS